ncbi:hypothetical protein COD67_07240 [Bacillus cereus]|nr:hypothetical protein COD67_07240 [Bacillus cereus]
MKKLVLTGVLSAGTLVGPNLLGLEAITVNAASFSNVESNIEKQNKDYVVGSIIDVYKNEFTVEYKGNDGKDHLVVAKHNDQQTFNEGDKVKVLYKSQWKLQNPGTHFEQGIAPDNSISKVTK